MKFALILFVLISQLASADIVLIAHKKMPINQLSKDDIQNIYLGNRQIINNLRIIPLDQEHDSPTRLTFYALVFNMPHNQIISHWSRLIFTGKGQAPIALAGNNSILDFVRHNPNVIGYIDEKYLTPDVKVLYRSE